MRFSLLNYVLFECNNASFYSFIYLFICLFIYLFIYLFTSLFIYLHQIILSQFVGVMLY